MGKKLPTTPRSRVRAALRQLFLRSRERAACLKAAGNRCAHCGVKASTARGKEQKIQCHHKRGIGNWDRIINEIFSEILCDPALMEAICPACHDKIHHPVSPEKLDLGEPT